MSCRKDKFITDSSAELEFSNDSVIFDTVFTTLGSTTQQLKIYNNHKKKIKISSIKLLGNSGNQYRINVDGEIGREFKDIVINEKDSLYIFVEVTIDPNNSNSPLVVTDQIVFETNGNQQHVDLVAWGQDAHYFYPDTKISGLPPFSILPNNHSVWINDKPYVIFGYLVVDSAQTLEIKEGVQIFFNQNAGLWVYKDGGINVTGNKDNPVVFQGLRLEQDYKDIPGQWDRIWINENGTGYQNEITYAIIKNAYIGLQAEILETKYIGQKLILNNTIIKNCSGWGFLSRAYDTEVTNTLIANCVNNVVALVNGGKHNWVNCTIANYTSPSKGKREDASLYLNNSGIDLNANFVNCILYGNIDNELQTEVDNTKAMSYNFENSIVKAIPITGTNFINVKNEDPLFNDPGKDYFQLKSGSPAIDHGKAGLPIPFIDITGASRSGLADVGAYEYQ